MGDMGDMFRANRERIKELKRTRGTDCPGCKEKFPKACPTRLLPGQQCRTCGFTAMTNLEYKRHRSCGRKRGFKSRSKAWKFLKRRWKEKSPISRAMNIYECKYCGLYHVATRIKDVG